MPIFLIVVHSKKSRLLKPFFQPLPAAQSEIYSIFCVCYSSSPLLVSKSVFISIRASITKIHKRGGLEQQNCFRVLEARNLKTVRRSSSPWRQQERVCSRRPVPSSCKGSLTCRWLSSVSLHIIFPGVPVCHCVQTFSFFQDNTWS